MSREASAATGRSVMLAEAARVWARVVALSFGGPAAQIGVTHRLLVEEQRWISERRFLHALNFRMLLPGPVATQRAAAGREPWAASSPVGPPSRRQAPRSGKAQHHHEARAV